MFEMKKLILCSYNNELFDYNFKSGINYFKGKNDSGKTVFYSFIDYMFGSSSKVYEKEWFINSLKYAILEFSYHNITYCLKRELNKEEVTYLKYKNEEWGLPISIEEYKEKLNSIFTIENSDLIKLRDFVEEDLTYRTFTIFNFFGENYLGRIVDFFDKTMDIKYAVKLPMILNYLFNDNQEEIYKLKIKLAELEDEVKELESSQNKYSFIIDKINTLLPKLNIQLNYNGKNKNIVNQEVKILKSLEESKRKQKRKPISELESMFNDINEQIKYYENATQDSKQIQTENENRKLLIKNLSSIIEGKKDYEYLISPIQKLLIDLDKSISFSKYLTNKSTINKLKEQKKIIKKEIIKNEYRFDSYSLSEKANYIAIIEDSLQENISDNSEELKIKRQELRTLKEKIKYLQNSDNENKINNFSSFITQLYMSAESVSDIVTTDKALNEFKIKYFKKGNTLQPQIIPLGDIENKHRNYYVGSSARFTIIQLCGYLSFLKLLIEENKYPIIPFLIIDHISKPFDNENRRAIGLIFKKFYKSIDKSKIQTFIFEDEKYEDLSIIPDHYINLINENKTGFNPFFKPNNI